MPESIILPQEVRDQLIQIKRDILRGKISLLELELNPLFQEIIDSVSTTNIFQYSHLYKETNDILYQKFEELKNLLIRMDNEQKFLDFLKKSSPDSEIALLFKGCWRTPFQIGCLSFNFLQESQNKLSMRNREPIKIKELSRIESKDQFLLEIPLQKFTEKMNDYFRSISDKLPCNLDKLFDTETDQLVIYEYFIYLLHLLQLGKIKYQKDTKTFYI
ncbi:MAG: hypothetical protein P8Y23_12790 [Candidatus Lokiarchaeota archaeon]|jgi:hypothetical protein